MSYKQMSEKQLKQQINFQRRQKLNWMDINYKVLDSFDSIITNLAKELNKKQEKK